METVTPKIWGNIVQMLTDRKFRPEIVSSGVYRSFTKDDESIWVNDKGKRLVLYLLIEQPKLKNNTFTILLKKYDNDDYDSLIILTSKKEMNATITIAKDCRIFIQCINYRFFCCNVARHLYQPTARLRRYEEISSYGTKEEFPHVLLSDELVVYYGFREGDVVEYQRPGELYWRVVR